MAGRKCTICEHQKRKEIDKACIREGAILRTIAHHFALSEDSLKRHVKSGHIAAKISRAVKAQEIVEADNLLNEIQEIHKFQKDIFNEARTRTAKNEEGKSIPNPDNKLALEALRDQSRTVELKGKVLGSFKGDKPNVALPIPVEITLNIAEEVRKVVKLLPEVQH